MTPPDRCSEGGPVRLAFLGCGHIAGVHSRHLRALGGDVRASYASRDLAKAEEYRRRYGGEHAYGSYQDALVDPAVQAVVVAVPPRMHLDLALRALDAGKHVLVEKPAFLRAGDYITAIGARDRAGRVVLVGENDHYKPLAVRLRRLLAQGVIGEPVLAQVTSVARRVKRADDWRNDEAMAGGGAFFEEGIHWLHLVDSLGPRITAVEGYQPAVSRDGPDTRPKSMMVAFRYSNGAVGVLQYSREVPSLLLGLRFSKIYGRRGVITFESNGLVVLAAGRGLPRVFLPALRDLRGYQAMYRDLVRSIRTGKQPQMSLERAHEDHVLMERVLEGAGGGA